MLALPAIAVDLCCSLQRFRLHDVANRRLPTQSQGSQGGQGTSLYFAANDVLPSFLV